MNLLIIGLGQIGKAHLNSFFLSKKKYNIFLFDINKIEKNFLNQKNIGKTKIEILSKFPKKFKFDLCIVATNSLERFAILKKLFKFNKVNITILEKYIFTKTIHYKSLRKDLFNISERLFINLWGSVIADTFNLKLKKKKLEIFVNIKNGRFITNAIHYLDFYCFLTMRDINFFKINIKKVIGSKRKNYKEILGSILAKNDQGSIKIFSKKNITYDNIKIIDGKDIYKIMIAINKKCIVYKNKKMFKKIDFPYAYNSTSKIYENYLSKKRKKQVYFNFKSNYKISEKIINEISKLKKNVYIT